MLIGAIREIFSELAVKLNETRVAVFADVLTDRQLDLVVNNRVTGLLSRQDSMRTISDQLIQVAAGNKVLFGTAPTPSPVTPEGQFRCAASSRLQKLTDRQWMCCCELLRAAAFRGAEALSISEKAVKAIVSHHASNWRQRSC